MDLIELSRRLENIVRIGTVHSVDHAAVRCRVQSGGLLTQWLAWIESRAGETTTWNPPTVGEQCIVFSPSGEAAGGIVLYGIHSTGHQPPSHAPEKHVIKFPDGAVISYDHAAGHLEATGIITGVIQADTSVTIDTVDVFVTGRLTVDGLLTYRSGMQGTGGSGASAVIDGDVSVTGDVMAGGISLRGHVHDEHDGGTTGAPK